VPTSVRVCGFWTWRAAAVPSVSLQRASARRYLQRTCLPSCSSGSRRVRANAGAIVHLHSTHSVAVSCLADVNPADVLPPITAYYVMKIGTLPLIPYYRPGDKKLAEAVRAVAHKHHAVLLANHGPVVAGSSLSAAGAAVEELEETARLHLLLHGHPTRILTPEQITELREAVPS
jgi:3-dehydro-4-phosphotetronate decarboxylase